MSYKSRDSYTMLCIVLLLYVVIAPPQRHAIHITHNKAPRTVTYLSPYLDKSDLQW